MDKSLLARTTIIAILSFLVLTIAHAGTPVISLIPLTANSISVSVNEVKIIKYQITNRSKKTHTLVMQPITGINQIITSANDCSNSFVLSWQQSCILSLQVSGSALQGPIIEGPKVCEQGNRLMCYQPSIQNRLHITQGIAKYTVGGTITGLTGTITLLNNGANALSVSTDGSFTFSTPIAEGSPYLVTVGTQPNGQTCTVASGSGIMSGANVTNVTVTCSTNTYTIGGTITGLVGTVTLLNNGVDPTSVSVNGPFTFSTPLAEGSTYHVTIGTQPPNQTCNVASGSGTVSGNVTDVTVNCATRTHTVGGTITGLTGTVILLNNGINPTPLTANGSFTFSMPVAEGSPYYVTVGTQPNGQTCTPTNNSGTMGGSDVTDVAVGCITNNTFLTVNANGTIPVNSGSGALTVTNTGIYTAYNVHAVLPGGWTGVSQDASECASIAPNNGTCTLHFSSTTPYVAQGNITITGDNISSPPQTALAFTINDYLVWSMSGNTALVLASSDVSASQVWSTSFNNIPNINETSTNPPDACNGATDGSCNTNQLAAQYGTSYTDYAAGLCYQIALDNTGPVALGTWYLPAICQMGNSMATCAASGLANIEVNLFKLGFGDLQGGYAYWSSTQYSGQPIFDAWFHAFSTGSGVQSHTYKGGEHYVRCVRAINF
ncbi:DUF1566 domain-containing protein [Legionella saoudiensis]|uniref:DUF1566 domain-containing protein n=1 Tax=Legionella saoudiensis TaxID=1750561 RepID=UPI0007312823|nr:DUF1566 domain-containing protein [Legionella saoudiensis]